MNSRQHALLARWLVGACGGLDEAAAACRLNRSRLAEFQDRRARAFMPADVLNDLELYAGEALYSRALAQDRPTSALADDVCEEACDTAEDAAALQRAARIFSRSGALTPRERDALMADALALKDHLARLIVAVGGGEP